MYLQESFVIFVINKTKSGVVTCHPWFTSIIKFRYKIYHQLTDMKYRLHPRKKDFKKLSRVSCKNRSNIISPFPIFVIAAIRLWAMVLICRHRVKRPIRDVWRYSRVREREREASPDFPRIRGIMISRRWAHRALSPSRRGIDVPRAIDRCTCVLPAR